MSSLKISPSQLQRIKQARIEYGWAIDRPEWLIEASKILKPTMNWEKDEKLAVSIGSWKRFLNGKPIKPTNFKAFCQVLGLNWQEVIDSFPQSRNKTTKYDWGEAADRSMLVGRASEIDTLKQWIAIDRVRLVSVLGVCGIGKTSLANILAREMAGEFSYVIWRSLHKSLSVEKLIDELVQFLTPCPAKYWSPAILTTSGTKEDIDISVNLSERITLLINLLRTSRCLIILDGVESILQSGSLAGNYHFQHDGYGELMRRIGESAHQSCLVVTGQEQVRELRRLQGTSSPVRVMKLTGLQQEAVKILNFRGVLGSKEEMDALISRYHGNPLALEIISATIKNTFNNDIADFLKVPIIFGEINDLLMIQSQRLSEIEKIVIRWLVNYGEPARCYEIATNLPSEAHGTIISALDSLLDRSFIRLTERGFTPHEMVVEYVNDQHLDLALF
jgi:AAA ATPase domain